MISTLHNNYYDLSVEDHSSCNIHCSQLDSSINHPHQSDDFFIEINVDSVEFALTRSITVRAFAITIKTSKNNYTKSCTDDWLHTISIMRSSEPDASISPSWLKLSVLTGQLQRYKTMIMQGIGARINLHMTFNKCNLTVFLYLIRFYLKEKVFKFFTHTLHYYS